MLILPFASDEANLDVAGGKGANLARLSRLGFLVPPGFIIVTEAYRRFVLSNSLEGAIRTALDSLSAADAAGLEQASATIRAAFAAGVMPVEVASAIRAAYAGLHHTNPSSEEIEAPIPVAVRSSATAEDLPDLSFAGQQDTFLNISGEAQLLDAVIRCWSSLWTGRAIGYRMRNAIPHADVSLAVVVQAMVASEASGVLFTANPLSGLRGEAVIDATLGLCEALVSGLVEPDHYLVDATSGAIREKTLGAKALSTRGKAGGGVETVVEAAATRQALSDEKIAELVALGQQVQRDFAFPQDIEWALAGGNLYLLQARPITSLYPLPQESFDPLIVWIAFGSVQGLVGPMTPLGQDVGRYLAAGGASMFGLRPDPENVQVFASAGERLWVKISDLIRNPAGSRIVLPALEFLEPSIGQIVRQLVFDPRMGAGKGRLKLSTLWRVARFFLPLLARLVRNALRPEKARADFDAVIAAALAAAQIPPAADRYARLANIMDYLRHQLASAFAFLLPRFIPTFGPSMGALNLLNKIAGEDRLLVFEVTRSLPGNVTTQMDLALWHTAAAIRADPAAASVFAATKAPELALAYLSASLPPAAQKAIAGFMDEYGMRGVAEVDIGQPSWSEDPTAVMHTLQSYLAIDPEKAPDVVFKRGEQAAQAAIEKLAARARQQPGGWLKEKMVRAAARRIRNLMGVRESPKFFAVRAMGVVSSALLQVGKEFVAAGTLKRPDDLFFLKVPELDALAREEQRDWQALVDQRRMVYDRELRRRQVPRVLVSDGRAFYEGIGAETDRGDVLTGSPVSPGMVEGAVRVVLNPHATRLLPGEILVCPGTDPGWTPLFLSAGGLITEVGGMMTHGSVVAREYGIPAVVGVHQATQRLKDGQRIRLDGTSGKIILLGETEDK